MWVNRASYCSAVNCVQAEWHSASNPSGNCVEAAWESEECSTNSCVVATQSQACPWVHVRDSKLGDDGQQLVWLREEWDGGRVLEFVAVPWQAVPARVKTVAIARDHDAAAQWYRVAGVTEDGTPAELFFDQGEVDRWQERDVRKFAVA